MAKSFVSGESQKHKCKSLKAGTATYGKFSSQNSYSTFIDFMGNNYRRLLKDNWYSRLSSNDNLKKESKEKLQDKSKTMRQLNSMLSHYKRSNMTMVEHNVNTIKSKGNKTARAPGRIKQKNKGVNKLKIIYKQLWEKLRLLQVTSEKVYQKSLRIKEYESKCKSELLERERRIEEREQQLGFDKIDSSEQNKKEEFNDIIQHIRSIDTRKGMDDIDMFEQTDEQWKNERINQNHNKISPNLFRNEFDEEESQNQVMIKSLEPDELEFRQTQHQYLDADIQMVEASTWMTNRKVDQSISAIVSQANFDAQVEIITTEQIQKINNFDKNYQEFLQQKNKFEKN